MPALSQKETENSERISRWEAAERLTDLAYALLTGDPSRLGADPQFGDPISEEVLLKRELSSSGGQVHLDLELSWSSSEARDH